MKPDPIKEKIQSLCPDVADHSGFDLEGMARGAVPTSVKTKGSPITLPIVLRAIRAAKEVITLRNSFAESELHFYLGGGDGKVKAVWNLLKNYDDQDEATKAFIGSLILN